MLENPLLTVNTAGGSNNGAKNNGPGGAANVGATASSPGPKVYEGDAVEGFFDSGSGNADVSYGWEEGYQRPWEEVREVAGLGFVLDDAEERDWRFGLSGGLEDMFESAEASQSPGPKSVMRRGLLRYAVLCVDLSASALLVDFKPDRLRFLNAQLPQFVRAFFQKNPLAHMAVVVLAGGASSLACAFHGNADDVLRALAPFLTLESCVGAASLQRGLERALALLQSAPEHVTREILMIWGSLRTSDAGDVLATVKAVHGSKARCAVVSLAAEMHVLRFLSQNEFVVALNETHFKEALRQWTIPPPVSATAAAAVKAVPVGFASVRAPLTPAVCACHGELRTGGYACPCCMAVSCSLPARCGACHLFLVRASDCSAAFKHLLPLHRFKKISHTAQMTPALKRQHDQHIKVEQTSQQQSSTTVASECFACHESLTQVLQHSQCPKCSQHYCTPCHIFLFTQLKTCPSCDVNV